MNYSKSLKESFIDNVNLDINVSCVLCLFLKASLKRKALPQNRKSQICQLPNPPIPKPLITDLAIEKSNKRQIRHFFLSVKRQIWQFFYPPITDLAKEKSDKRQIRQFFFSVKRQIWQFFYPPITDLAKEKSDKRQIRHFFLSAKRQIRQ